MSSTLPTEKTSSNAAVEVVAVLEGLSRVSAEGFLGLRPLFRLVGSRPILEIQMLRMKEREREIQWDNEKEDRKELQREREREENWGGASRPRYRDKLVTFVTIRF